MKFVIFTPALQASAIGRVASMTSRALLAQGHSVAVVRTEIPDLLGRATHDFGTPAIPWTASGRVDECVEASDILVYHLGDHYPYHAGGIDWLMRVPGIVCLHDFFVGHLFWGWAEGRRPEARRVLSSLYGEQVAQSYFDLGGPGFIAATKDLAPMTEWLARPACGVVTHSSWGVGRVRSACPGPVRVVPLAYEAPSLPEGSPAEAPAGFRILTIGHVNPNKRAESVIAAIGASATLREKAHYRLVGAIQPEMRAHLSAVAEAAGVRLTISGESSYEELGRALREADVVCCLRWPTVEAASASTVEAMLSGKAVVVEDLGFYAELPDDVVLKIRPEHEIPDLQAAFERLADAPSLRNEMGVRAAAWAGRTFTAENYAGQLVEAASECWRAQAKSRVAAGAAEQIRLWRGSARLCQAPEVLGPLDIFANDR